MTVQSPLSRQKRDVSLIEMRISSLIVTTTIYFSFRLIRKHCLYLKKTIEPCFLLKSFGERSFKFFAALAVVGVQ